jgi:hypothetical protein
MTQSEDALEHRQKDACVVATARSSWRNIEIQQLPTGDDAMLPLG